MGDDKRMAISEEFSFHTNQTHSEVVFDGFGLVYTDAKKSGNVVPFDGPDNLSFVKRDAVYHEDLDLFFGALDIQTILNMVCYTKGEDVVDNIRHRAQNAIRELSFHSQKTWDEYMPLICEQVGPIWRKPFPTRVQTRDDSLRAWNA